MTVINRDNESACCRRVKKVVKHVCSAKTVKKRLPILEWLPKYKYAYIIQDIIAGITVGLTAIPQGIADAGIAGIPPEYGLYASLTSGIVYIFLGSCYNVAVGPTAIIAAMTAKYVANYSIDFAILAGFLSGSLILIMGVLQLGFLVEFISMPVISGFTTAAALQIAALQLKSLFGLSGSPGNYFAEYIYHFIMNIGTIKLWDPVLGFTTIVMLILLKKMGQGCKRTDSLVRQMKWFVSLSRNTVVVIFGMILAYILKITTGEEPLAIVGDIGSGLPKYSWPPFTTTVRNETYSFADMLQVMGAGPIAIPLVTVIQTIAIAKTFAEDGRLDATQEMIAIGLCNIIGSFGQSMPVTGSFTRTVLNHVSGVATPAGGISRVLLIIVALTTLTSTFYYIPKASLAGLVIVAMYSIVDYVIWCKLWRVSKRELLILIITMIVCLSRGLEYGIITGVIIEAALLLYNFSRPSINTTTIRTRKGDLLIVSLSENISYCASAHVRRAVLKESMQTLSDTVIILDGTILKSMDFTAASNLISIIKDLNKKSYSTLLLNFNKYLKNLCLEIDITSECKFVYASNAVELFEAYPGNV